jgi:hypothetical protein
VPKLLSLLYLYQSLPGDGSLRRRSLNLRFHGFRPFLAFAYLTAATKLNWLPTGELRKSKLCYDRRSVGQSALVSSTHLGLTTKYSLLPGSFVLVDVGSSLSLSLTKGRFCRLPESQSPVISLLSVCTIYRLHTIKCIYNIYKASVSSGSVQQIMPLKSSGPFTPWNLRYFL